MYKLTLLILGILTAFRLPAQTTFTTVEEVWKYADAHNITIRTAAYETDRAGITHKQSQMAFLPQVNATGTFTDNTSLQTTLIPAVIFGGPPGVYSPVQFGQKYIYNAGFNAQMDLLNLQTWFNLRISEESREMAKASEANARKVAYQQIASQFYGYLLNKEAYRLALVSTSVADSVLQSVTNKFKEGLVSMGNVDLAKLNKARAEQTLITAQYQMQTTRNNLKGLLNLTVTDSLNIESSLKTTATPSATGAFTEDPALRQAVWQSRISLSYLKASRSAFFPTVSLLYSTTTQQNDNKFEPFQSGPKWFPASYWTVRASWNIFTAGSRWASVQRNQISYEEDKLLLENVQKQSAINDENLRLYYARAVTLLTNAESIMNLSFDNYTHISNKYQQGLSSIEERLTAFTDYITYQNQYINTYADLLIQQYHIKIRQQSF